MAPEERHDSSARSDAIEPIARVLAHEFKGLAVDSPAGAAAAADVYTDVSVSVPNVLPGVAIGAGSSCLLIRFDQIWEGTKPGHKYHYPCKFCTMPSSFRAICCLPSLTLNVETHGHVAPATARILTHMPVFFVAAECAPADVGDVLVPPRCISNREARKGGER